VEDPGKGRDDLVRVEFPHRRQVTGHLAVKGLDPRLGGHVGGKDLHVLLQGGVDLFDDKNLAGSPEVALQEVGRQGPGGGEFEDAYPPLQAQDGHGLPGVEVAGAAGDDEQLRKFGTVIGVEGAILEEGRRLLELLLLGAVLELRRGKDHADDRSRLHIEHGAVAPVGRTGLRGRKGSQGDVAAGVGHAGDAPDHDDVAEGLGQVEGPPGQVLGLLKGPWFEEGDLHELGEEP
jgi:hypothetical protein